MHWGIIVHVSYANIKNMGETDYRHACVFPLNGVISY